MKAKWTTACVCITAFIVSTSFCGFYVSKADGTLKNKTSQVILTRFDNQTVVTMYNDFEGNMENFAMVVPVPVVLQKKDVKVIDNGLFQRLNDYSAPRLVEYYDENPCVVREYEMLKEVPATALGNVSTMKRSRLTNKDDKVTIEAQYSVGEYDILILSAKESSGLKEWLTENGYKIPPGAEEVLDPYIKGNLKFFVVKVNIAEQKKLKSKFLRPLQISFSSPKFMLPIRLGMANADGDQDLLVYAFSKRGRVETTNYRTAGVPTGKNIPLFVQSDFARFYGNVFENDWKKEGKSVSLLEYAWDVSPANNVKCDPCVSTPPDNSDLALAGVSWIAHNTYQDYVNEYDNDKNKVFFTRLHIRYNRKSFPQDLMFQETPNNENFQARYIITHPATGDLSCAGGKKYLQELKERRKKELETLTTLTGRDLDEWKNSSAKSADEAGDGDVKYAKLMAGIKDQQNGKKRVPIEFIVFGSLLIGSAGFLKWKGMV